MDFKIEIGKEIDSALGDALRGLLKKPAEETGGLIAEAIGILKDKTRMKRILNTQIGMKDVARKLKDRGIDPSSIEPPKEEEFELLLNGISLSDDESVRDMWTGLFAKAISPNSGVVAERSFISTLQSLDPMDAKIIDFIAFTMKTDHKIRSKNIIFRPKDPTNITPEELSQINLLQKEQASRIKDGIKAIKQKSSEYGIDKLEGETWPINLIRLGIIERNSNNDLSSIFYSSQNKSDINRYIYEVDNKINRINNYLSEYLKTPKKVLSEKNNLGNQIILEIRLSKFGIRLADACGLI